MTTTDARAPERIVTAVQVERRLLDLSHEVDEAYESLRAAEMEFHTAKATYEVEYARATLQISAQAKTDESRPTVAEKEARALLKVEAQRMALAAAEAVVRAARANANRLQTQVDLARSVGTTLRASIDMST